MIPSNEHSWQEWLDIYNDMCLEAESYEVCKLIDRGLRDHGKDEWWTIDLTDVTDESFTEFCDFEERYL